MELAIEGIAYDAATHRVTVHTADLLFADHFRLELDGDDTATDGGPGISATSGAFLEGGDYTAEFDLTVLNLVGQLTTDVEDLGLSTGAETSLVSKLEAVVRLTGNDVPQDTGILALLDAFKTSVNLWYERGQISQSDRDDLLAETDLILLGLTSL